MNSISIYPNLMKRIPFPLGISVREEARMVAGVLAITYLFSVMRGKSRNLCSITGYR
jgi:hypothetical protein